MADEIFLKLATLGPTPIRRSHPWRYIRFVSHIDILRFLIDGTSGQGFASALAEPQLTAPTDYLAGVTLFDLLEAGPVPTAFVAFIVNV